MIFPVSCEDTANVRDEILFIVHFLQAGMNLFDNCLFFLCRFLARPTFNLFCYVFCFLYDLLGFFLCFHDGFFFGLCKCFLFALQLLCFLLGLCKGLLVFFNRHRSRACQL